jgi:hypothetical protein
MRNEKQAKAYAKQQGRPRRQTLIDHHTPPKIIFLKPGSGQNQPKPANHFSAETDPEINTEISRRAKISTHLAATGF